MKILSLFDGMSCGQIAINRLGIKDYIYYASEIDKYAIEVTQHNYPNTIQVGDITSIKGEDFKDIHLIMGGSPCQGFSFAGKQLNFEDERSKLFFEFVRLVKEIKPKYFLLENVKMKKKFQEIISENLFGINPIEINSDLVSAQNRKRLYWIGESQENGTYKQVKIEQPKDNGIFLKDILEDKVDEKYYMTEKQYKNLSFESLKRLYTKKAPTLSTMQGGHRQPKINLKDNNFTSFSQDNVFVGKDGKVPTLTAGDGGNRPKMYDFDNMLIRKLTPIECERLQTVPNNFTSIVSNSQRYKMLGNGWTVDIIVHILKNLKL